MDQGCGYYGTCLSREKPAGCAAGACPYAKKAWGREIPHTPLRLRQQNKVAGAGPEHLRLAPAGRGLLLVRAEGAGQAEDIRKVGIETPDRYVDGFSPYYGALTGNRLEMAGAPVLFAEVPLLVPGALPTGH